MLARLVFSSLAGALAMAGTAHADDFKILPDGSLVFNASYTTQGILQCHAAPACSGGGDTITIGSGADSITISFAGVTHSAELGNIATQVSIGTFTAAGNALFPSIGPLASIFSFRLFMTQSSPEPGAAVRFMSFGPGGGDVVPLLEAPSTWFGFPTGSNPPGFNYSQIVYSLELFPFGIRNNGVTSLNAQAGVVPEPTTIALMGAGIGLMAMARKRRRPR